MGSQRRRFDNEFKREAVRMAYESGRPVVEVARELDLRPEMLRRWRHGQEWAFPFRVCVAPAMEREWVLVT